MIMIARKFSLLRQLVWAATLAAGFATLWSVLAIWLGTSIQEAWQGGKRNWPPREDFVVRSNGTPLIRTTPPENYSLATYRDLNGGVQDVLDRNDLLPVVYMSGEHRSPDLFTSRSGWDQLRAGKTGAEFSGPSRAVAEPV
jgi:hypothetical protein